jgi:alkanesulfonate monooxygenase SsuD/methylene tetrahydromethanopterin reductase-like flavin-dependent oxidoreductase (luciferase family)
MEIGIGFPTTIRGANREQLLEWARRADAAGFSSLGTIDRLVYPNYEPLIALSAAAAVTERIRLTTSVLLAPLRTNAALFAKQAASLQALSNGRLVLGLAVGARQDDFEASGVPLEGRGKRLTEILDELKRVWADGMSPDVSDDPPRLIVGGTVDAAFRRAAKYADGWIAGGGPPEYFAEGRDKVRAAFADAGRAEQPRTMSLSYFSLDEDPEAQVRATIGDYYTFLGDYADQIVAGAAKGEDAVRERVRGFEEVECDELILCPASADPEQVDKLAAVVL